MITLPYIDLSAKEGIYTAILPEILIDTPETEFGHYVLDGIGHFSISENGSLGFAEIYKQINLRFCDVTDQDLYNNIEEIKTVSQLKRMFKAGINFDERMIVTFVEFVYKPF